MISSGCIISPIPSLCSAFFEVMTFTNKFSFYGLKMTVSSSQVCIFLDPYTTGKGRQSLSQHSQWKSHCISQALIGSHDHPWTNYIDQRISCVMCWLDWTWVRYSDLGWSPTCSTLDENGETVFPRDNSGYFARRRVNGWRLANTAAVQHFRLT